MKELTQIRQAVIDALCDAGLHALAAFPDRRAPRDTASDGRGRRRRRGKPPWDFATTWASSMIRSKAP